MLVEVIASILWEFDRNTGGDIGPQQRILTAWKDYQKPFIGICKRLVWSWYSHSGAVVHGKALRRRKISLIFREFFQNSGKKGEMGWISHSEIYFAAVNYHLCQGTL